MCLSFSSHQGGCASVIVSLTVQCPQDLSPYSGRARRRLYVHDQSKVWRHLHMQCVCVDTGLCCIQWETVMSILMRMKEKKRLNS